MNFESSELKFPLDCHFRIIAENHDGARLHIQAALEGVGVTKELKFGTFSKKGSYITFNVDVRVDSLEEMRKIADALQKAKGVRMVI